ncbi:MAG: hypothetical protein QXJ62_05455 [Nitrososphaeria archaeon]
MSEFGTWFIEQFWGIITGIIISLFVYFIVNFIPVREDIRYRAIFYRRKISKLILNPIIKVSYTVKTQNLEDKKLKLNDLLNVIKEKLARSRSDFTYIGEKGSACIFTSILGKTEVEITVTPSYIVKRNEGKEELIVDYLQCDFKLRECKYRNFEGHLLDMVQIFRRFEANIENVIGKWIGESLSCDIQRLYEFVGVLKDLKMSSLTGKIGGQYEIELYENKLVIYGSLETTMTSMIKDIITYYY